VILLLYGGDEAAIRRRLRELKEQADGGTGMLVNNLAEIESRDARPADIIAPAMAPPFLAPLRLVVVENVLARYEPRGGARGSRAPAGWAEFPAMLEGVPPTSLIVFVGRPFLAEQQRRQVTDANPLVQLLKKVPGAAVEHYPELKRDERVRYIREEAAIRGIRFRAGAPPRDALAPGEEPPPETDPVAYLANLLGGNTLLIGNELDKLALWAMGREVTVLDAMRVCAGEREPDHFRMVDALMDGDLATALEMLRLRLERGEAQQAVLGAVFERYRTLGALAGLLEDGAPEEEIDRQLGGVARYPNLKKAAVERARRHGTAGVREAFGILVEADRAFKRNEIDEDLALEVAFARLARLAPVRGPMAAGRRGAPARGG
jgi:DNA polymerase-3 subunit delta